MFHTNGHYHLSHEALRYRAPSIFADRPYDKMTEKYGFVPTVTVLDRLAGEGFLPVSVNESRTRIDAKRGYLKHSLRLRRSDDIGPIGRKVGDVVPEIILTNSHDGSSAYVLEGGLFRLICSNGMCLPLDDAFERVRLRHSQGIADNVIDGCIRVLDSATRFAHVAQEWHGIALDRKEQLLLADHALQLRWANNPDTGNPTAPILPAKLLQPRRDADVSNDLFTVFNRIQENLTKGGIRGIGGTGRRTTTRAVTSVDADLKLNRQLMTLATEFAKLKTAA